MHKQFILVTSVLFFLVFIVGCSANLKSSQTTNNYSSQSALVSLLSSELSFEETEHKVGELVALNVLKEDIFKNNIPETTRLIVLAKEVGAVEATETMVRSQPERGVVFAELALHLFYSDRLQIIENLRLGSTLSEEEIIEAALNAKVAANKVALPTASGTGYEIVPLINSASIVLFQQSSERTAFVAFKEKDKTEWRIASPLHWEPVRSALSGSIVKLEPDTAYDVRIEIFESGFMVEEKFFEFKTRLNYPPINPNLVFKLSEIYSDGQLDLTKLNIHGDESGWAKIVGDAENPIVAGESDEYAINIGSNSYIIFENVTVKGGRRHGIYSRGAHHLWFKGCDVSNWGRVPTHFHKGKGYESINDIKPINYDAGMLLYKSGVVVVEGCQIHSPNYGSNHWGYGHPNGTTAMLIMANHPDYEKQGQYIIRNNRFFGTNKVRFNDVIESRSNARVFGGFMKNSAIHGNYLAYANDDIIELDGGQSNVLFYDNEIEQGYCGVSAVPNMMGPSFIFNNHIHNLGDERGASWAAIKLGGLFSYPIGLVNIFQNLIYVRNNGIAGVKFGGSGAFWANIRNNVIVSSVYNSSGYGFSVIDKEKYTDSEYVNNLFFNKSTESPIYDANIDLDFLRSDLVNLNFVEQIENTKQVLIEFEEDTAINNFSSYVGERLVIGLLR
jgi:hypothetical protein